MWNDNQEVTFTAIPGEWLKCSVLVEGTGGVDRFAIRESESMPGAGINSIGPLIDDVHLEPVATFSPTLAPVAPPRC